MNSLNLISILKRTWDLKNTSTFVSNPNIGIFKEIKNIRLKNNKSAYNSELVYYFEKYDIYIKFECNYNSYSGYTDLNWDNVYEVKPKTKTIIVYE